MNRHLATIPAAALLALVTGPGCTRSGEAELTQARPDPRAITSEDAPAQKGSPMKSYLGAAPVGEVRLKSLVSVEEPRATLLAVAPDGETWAAASGHGVRVLRGERELAALEQRRHLAAGAVHFAPDGATLRLGVDEVDVAAGRWRDAKAIPDLVAWAKAGGHAAPRSLTVEAAQQSADGQLLIVAATGVTRDRERGLHRPRAGDIEWLIALDGRTREPREVIWSGRDSHRWIAISADHVAAGGGAGLVVAARDALTNVFDLSKQLRPAVRLAWSPDGQLLAAIGDKQQVALWRTGQWDAPAASWRLGSAYGSSLAFHPSRPVLFVGDRDGRLRIYSVAEAALERPAELAEHQLGGPIEALALSPQGTTLLAAVGHPTYEVLRFEVIVTP